MSKFLNINFVQSIVRAVMQALSGYLVGKGIASDSLMGELSGAILSLVAIAWSATTHADPSTK